MGTVWISVRVLFITLDPLIVQSYRVWMIVVRTHRRAISRLRGFVNRATSLRPSPITICQKYLYNNVLFYK